MQEININELKPHPRNNEFFDDMTGEKWAEFLESVKTSGVIEPIVITQDKTIVSGHQRVRALKELGKNSVICKVKIYDNEDEIIKDLLETNIRQRGDVGGSAKKVGLRIKELERLYGVRDGSSNPENTIVGEKNSFTQFDIAEKLNMKVRTYQNYKLLADMIPELEELLDTGIVTKTTALAIMKNLSLKEQEELITSMDTTKKITQREVQQYIDEIQALKATSQKPADYDSTKKQLNDYKSECALLKNQYNKASSEVRELRKQIESMQKTSPTEQYNQKLKDSTIFFCARVSEFIEKTGGYVWLTEHLNELPDYERKSYISAVNAVYNWASVLLNNINE